VRWRDKGISAGRRVGWLKGHNKIAENEDLSIDMRCGVLVGNHMRMKSGRRTQDKPAAIEDSIVDAAYFLRLRQHQSLLPLEEQLASGSFGQLLADSEDQEVQCFDFAISEIYRSKVTSCVL
jgi:hypothetical protein